MTRKILLVDDERDLVDLLQMRLEGEGFMVETAEDGQEALEKIKSVWPDIMLLDTVMPKIDGWEVCRRIRADPETEHIPIIIFTAGNASDCEERARSVGADRVLLKPFEPEELLGALLWSRHKSATASHAKTGGTIR